MAVSEPMDTGAVAGKALPQYLQRFNTRQIVEHWVLMFAFIALSVTGLAQKYYTAGWAEWAILNLGGIDYTRLIHRAFALLFTLGVIYHFIFIAFDLFIRHSRPSMLPTVRDFRDVVTTLRYSFGFVEKPAQFTRFDYRQKFEYWGIIFGSIIIIVSGFFLAYPYIVTQVLPGQLIAAAKEFHGNEATLAVITIVIWHLYDVILKPGIFPADTSIFSGKISRKRLEEEHALEYAELVGAAEEVEAPAPPAPPAEPPAG